jgi:DNA-binding Lrp family transcriptional regulator
LALPNLWFTLFAPAETFQTEFDSVRAALEPCRLLFMPALKRYKIDVVFDPSHRQRDQDVPDWATSAGEPMPEPVPCQLSESEKSVVRALQGQMPVMAEPFREVARQIGHDPDELLALLRLWEDSGILRRIALILQHRKIGFRANGMCVWPVDAGDVDDVGQRLASRPEVTHCYRRPAIPEFPYDLYAMIHTSAWESTRALFREISRGLGLEGGEVFLSVHEYKKTSHQLFIE